MNIKLADERKKIEATLKSRYSCHELINEYMAECEHQEGLAYWLQFEDLDDLLTDFNLYKEYNDESE